VGRRRREIGIRMALGLRPSQVIGGIVGRGGALVGIGIVVGIVASMFLGRIVASMLYGVGASDPMALAGASATLLGAGLAAAAIPAWRASRLDPAKVLRE
jgi:putative ABC transport system permease protein